MEFALMRSMLVITRVPTSIYGDWREHREAKPMPPALGYRNAKERWSHIVERIEKRLVEIRYAEVGP